MTEAEFREMWDGTPELIEDDLSEYWLASSGFGTLVALGFGALVGVFLIVQLVRWVW